MNAMSYNSTGGQCYPKNPQTLTWDITSLQWPLNYRYDLRVTNEYLHLFICVYLLFFSLNVLGYQFVVFHL